MATELFRKDKHPRVCVYTHAQCFTIFEKAETSQIFPVDFNLFPDYCWKIVNISIYLTKYSKIIPWMME